MKRFKISFLATVGLVAVASLFTVCKAVGSSPSVYSTVTGQTIGVGYGEFRALQPTEQKLLNIVMPVDAEDTDKPAELGGIALSDGKNILGIAFGEFVAENYTVKVYDTGTPVAEAPEWPGAGATPEPGTIVNVDSSDLMVKFGIKTAPYELSSITAQNVTDTFNAVYAYLNSIAVSDLSAGDSPIRLGDYIDLKSLTVAYYREDPSEPTAGRSGLQETLRLLGQISDLQNGLVDDGAVSKGDKLRLIVVGRNSFNGKNSNGSSAHIVFQFQNLPGVHRMNESGDYSSTNLGGYEASEMRKYLVDVSDSGGNFLAGLTNPSGAGVPASVLWAPRRKMAINADDQSGDSCVSILDLLWLPTERELFGAQSSSPPSETEENQARLEYYTTDSTRKKYMAYESWDNYWWEASPLSNSNDSFCMVETAGVADNYDAGSALGFAPAFCVRGTVEEEQQPEQPEQHPQ